MLAILTPGLGVGASPVRVLKSVGVWLVLVGCLVHAWCFARTRMVISGWRQDRPRWAVILDIASWTAIAIAALVVSASWLKPGPD